MEKDIKALAPTLLAAGISADEIIHATRPKEEPPPPPPPVVAPKRYRMVMENLLKGDDVSLAAEKACVPVDLAEAVKAGLEAVTADVADLPIIAKNAPMEEIAVKEAPKGLPLIDQEKIG